eukprot:6439352-Amphidinium_carterae.1
MKSQGVLGLRPDLGDVSEVRLLNRLVAVAREVDGTPYLTIEADGRHTEIFTTTLGLKPRSKGRTAPGEKPKDLDQTPLGAEL